MKITAYIIKRRKDPRKSGVFRRFLGAYFAQFTDWCAEKFCEVRRGKNKSPRRTGGPARAVPQQAKRAAQSARPKAPGRQGAGPARTRGNGDPARGRGTAGRARRRSAGAARDRGRRSRPQGAKSRRRAATTLAPGRGPGRANEEGTRSPTSEPPEATAQDQRAKRAANG